MAGDYASHKGHAFRGSLRLAQLRPHGLSSRYDAAHFRRRPIRHQRKIKTNPLLHRNRTGPPAGHRQSRSQGLEKAQPGGDRQHHLRRPHPGMSRSHRHRPGLSLPRNAIRQRGGRGLRRQQRPPGPAVRYPGLHLHHPGLLPHRLRPLRRRPGAAVLRPGLGQRRRGVLVDPGHRGLPQRVSQNSVRREQNNRAVSQIRAGVPGGMGGTEPAQHRHRSAVPGGAVQRVLRLEVGVGAPLRHTGPGVRGNFFVAQRVAAERRQYMVFWAAGFVR
mmetsp:Transcript_21497/g.48837  ORF Transcript_21497/g.48837 Transcript_21497/m.48837 type:complete len:274 (+) Transcript_21497:423-1244(+)